jgi:hypothetical protein
VLSLQHPDVHWFVPIELSKRGGTSTGGGDADKQIELVAEALGEEMAARREQPLYAPVVGLASHPVAAVRLLLKRIAITPAMGKRKVFIVGDAERLIPQLGTEVAANALLKALEEPPADSVIIITAADSNALLPTILSRVVLVRVARIADSAVTAFAQQTLGISNKDELEQRVTRQLGVLASSLHRYHPFRSLRSGDWFHEAPLLFALARCRFRPATDMLDGLAENPQRSKGGDTEKLVGAIARHGRSRPGAGQRERSCSLPGWPRCCGCHTSTKQAAPGWWMSVTSR